MDRRLRPNSETRRDFIQMSDDKFTFAALVDAGGYSTAIQQKYQGMLVTESKLKIAGAELPHKR